MLHETIVERPPFYPKQFAAIHEPKRISCIEASTKAGKAQPLNALVYTPDGPKRMGDIAVGDRVLTPASSASVVAIYLQGIREVWRITFADGAVVETDADHLWEVHQFKRAPQLVTTEQLFSWPPARRNRAWVPAIKPCAFSSRSLPIDPYLLGVFIGDGGMSGDSLILSSADDNLLEAVRGLLPAGHALKKTGTGYDWRVSAGSQAATMREAGTHLRGAVQRLGLGGKGSHEKFVPDVYRYNTVETRIAVLQGILDTDGFVDKHGQPGLEQTSERLARDVEEIVQSLGGSVLTRLKAVNGYRAKDGRFVTCRPVWRQVIRVADGSTLFRLERKRKLCRPKRKSGHRMFRDIEFARRAETQCIELDDDRQLYLTNGLIPTHNTSGCIAWLLEEAFAGRPGWNYWWVAPVSEQAAIAFRRMCAALPQGRFTPALSHPQHITLANGAVVWFKSGDKPNSLYGEDVYAAVVDEASRTKEDAWIALRSTLTYTRAKVRVIGNVHGRKNWFYQMARRAQRAQELFPGGDPEIAYHKIVANDAVEAGVLDAKEIEDARNQMPESAWRELFLAEAADDGGNPFGLEHIAACVKPLSSAPPAAWGWDFAKQRDYTVGIGLDASGTVCRFERFHHRPWGETMNAVATASRGVPALGDSTGVGDPIVEGIQRQMGQPAEGGTFQGYHFTQSSKQKLMEGLAVAIQARRVGFPPGVIVSELEQFEYEFTRTGVRYCMDMQTPVLTDDLRWLPVASLEAGDGVLGFDEEPQDARKTRQWRRAQVTSTGIIKRPCYRVLMDDGTEFVCSAEHLWLTASGNGPIRWLKTSELRGRHEWSKSPRFAPHRLIRLTDTWAHEHSYEAGYLAAAFDGEGSLSQLARNDHEGRTSRLSFAQRENEMADAIRRYLKHFGFEWSEQPGGGTNRDVVSFGVTGGTAALIRFLGMIRPQRLLAKLDLNLLGSMWTKADVAIEAVEYCGEREVVALGTTTSTFIANGFATHNSAPEGYFDDCVCALALAVMCQVVVPPTFRVTPDLLAKVMAMPRRRQH